MCEVCMKYSSYADSSVLHKAFPVVCTITVLRCTHPKCAAAAGVGRRSVLAAVRTHPLHSNSTRFLASVATQGQPQASLRHVSAPDSTDSSSPLRNAPDLSSKTGLRLVVAQTPPGYMPDPHTVSDEDLRNWLQTRPRTVATYNTLIHLLVCL